MNDPDAVLDEVKTILSMISPDFDCEPIDRVFSDVLRLFRGEYPGYRRCNTPYHDLNHATDIFMAMARLVHGAVLSGDSMDNHNITLGLICALLHDSGYIQEANDISGTGAKYTRTHGERSIELLGRYLIKNGFTQEDVEKCRDIINCTSIDGQISDARFLSEEIGLMGRLLGSADLMGQMSDRTYLEKLLLLFKEFQEGDTAKYESELDLLRGNPMFYEMIKKRLAVQLGGVNRYAVHHFRERWNIDEDLYQTAIERNENYLIRIIEKYPTKYRNHLRRNRPSNI